jgi:hypothetical protein
MGKARWVFVAQSVISTTSKASSSFSKLEWKSALPQTNRKQLRAASLPAACNWSRNLDITEPRRHWRRSTVSRFLRMRLSLAAESTDIRPFVSPGAQ